MRLVEVFGHPSPDGFTAQEAAEYLEVSMSTLRRFLASSKLHPSRVVGRNQMFLVPELRAFKKVLKTAKG
jgi:excisionase family DNA binding protein